MRSILLFSAGKESIFCLHHAKPSLLLHFNYGQKSYKKEVESLNYYSERFSVLANSIVVPKDLLNPPPGITEGVGNSHVPLRNLLFLTVAANYAVTFGYGEVIFGGVDSEKYTDNDVLFGEDLDRMFRQMYGVRVSTPVGGIKQDMVAHELMRRRMDVSHLWSCDQDGERHCGVCDKCRGYAVEKFNNPEPTKYQKAFYDRFC
jgi:7-cyano-7-deazaguanine synthase